MSYAKFEVDKSILEKIMENGENQKFPILVTSLSVNACTHLQLSACMQRYIAGIIHLASLPAFQCSLNCVKKHGRRA